ncbi:hypothetical protein PV325_010008 [Microctonus aethiopoides]|nr:hypothetical protein PV325_010008 [Microctonus aethiopoides]
MELSSYEEGFRLNDAASVCSMKSKAMIDALFEDSKSVCSSTYADCCGSVYEYSMNLENFTAEEQQRANSAVQAKIEAMFASIEAETGRKGECTSASLPVKYLGAAPVGGRIASVRGLQEPLRQLLERIIKPISAELEVSRRGLTFRTSESIEKTNPFRRIAVWSALRLRSRPILSESPINQFHHAFIPLVGDDQMLGDEKHADLYRTMRGLATNVACYPPIFAVVMRRPGAAKVLECHGFACKTEEDAITAAATLYKALLADLDCNRRHPRQSNGLGCVSLASVASSSFVDYTSVLNKNAYNNRLHEMLPQHPIRPPRVKKNSTSSSATECGSIRSVSNKITRRKKKMEIHTEDVTGTRKRNLQSSNEESIMAAKEINDNTSVLSTQGNNRQSKENSFRCRNQKINMQQTMNINREVKENETSYDNSYFHEMNYHKKTPSKENLFTSERNYSFVEKNGSIVGEVVNAAETQLFEKNHISYDLNSTGKSDVSTTSKSNPFYLTEHEVLSDCKKDNFENSQNSIYDKELGDHNDCRNKLYEDHFRNAEKIYYYDEENSSRSQIRKYDLKNKSNDNITFSKPIIDKNKSTINVCDQLISHKNSHKSDKIQRISRIDEFSRRNCRGPSNPTFISDLHNQKMKKRDRAGSEPPLSRTENVARTIHDIKLHRSQSDLEVDRGDLMTRVELPRRGSFLKQNCTRQPNSIFGGTPLGFTELFDEFRNQEGLTSVDDILDAIIDPEGMSFNELKPLYKEFLLKLASTLTQDELYQRSANIMKRRRRPQRRRSARKSCLLGRAIKRSVSKLKSGPTEFTSVIFPAKKFNDSFDSSSSCDIRNGRNRVLASRLSRGKSSWRRSKGINTSEDNDTCKRLARNTGANRSSSGYVSCSECSYDSESCTCISADKCYCSLSRPSPGHETVRKNATVCACDTDSCSDSNKCYCTRRPMNQPTILEQLRQHGIVPSEETLSRRESPERTKPFKTARSYASSRSLEFYKMRPSPVRSSSDNLALDYDLFCPEKKGQGTSKNEKVLVVSARDPHGRLVYVGGAEKNKKSFPINSNRAGTHHEVLSIKKSAEIAAVFGPSSVRSCRRTSSTSSVKSSVSMEAGLGYLP